MAEVGGLLHDLGKSCTTKSMGQRDIEQGNTQPQRKRVSQEATRARNKTTQQAQATCVRGQRVRGKDSAQPTGREDRQGGSEEEARL